MTDEIGPFEVDPGRPVDLAGRRGGGDGDDQEHGDDTPVAPLGVATGATDVEPFLEVSEKTVRALLTAQGSLVHGFVAIDKESDEWVWLQAELDAIVPPLTRIVNRYEPLRALAEVGDPLAVMIALGGYGKRSIGERAALIAAARAELDPDLTGQPMFRGTG